MAFAASLRSGVSMNIPKLLQPVPTISVSMEVNTFYFEGYKREFDLHSRPLARWSQDEDRR